MFKRIQRKYRHFVLYVYMRLVVASINLEEDIIRIREKLRDKLR